MKPNVRRILWMLVVASLALSGLSACSFSSFVGTGAGLGFAGFVTALLLLFGTTTQTGCAQACLSIEPPADVGVHACLSAPPPDAQVGPCLSMGDTGYQACLSIEPADVGPCLSPMPPDGGVGPCLDVMPPDADLGPCLSPMPPDATTQAEVKPAGQAVAAADRQEVLEKLQDRLPADVKDRLGLKKV